MYSVYFTRHFLGTTSTYIRIFVVKKGQTPHFSPCFQTPLDNEQDCGAARPGTAGAGLGRLSRLALSPPLPRSVFP